MTAQKTIQIFDRDVLIQRRKQAKQNLRHYDFLLRLARDRLAERQQDIKRSFHTGMHITPLSDTEEEILPPHTPASQDIITSTLTLHTINDLPGYLLQIRRALKPDGLFLAAMLGGETLRELRDAMSHAEMKIRGGLSPRVHPFADKQQMGALLQRAGFALPVVDSEIITVTYTDIFALMHDLRGMGETNVLCARDKKYTGQTFFAEADVFYSSRYAEADGRIPATFEMIFLLGWAPHESQQKPLPRGSGKTYLGDVL